MAEHGVNTAADAWAVEAQSALIEAQTMSESIGKIVETLLDGADSDAFPLLEAVNACLLRLDKAVDPLVERRLASLAEVRHG